MNKKEEVKKALEHEYGWYCFSIAIGIIGSAILLAVSVFKNSVFWLVVCLLCSALMIHTFKRAKYLENLKEEM